MEKSESGQQVLTLVGRMTATEMVKQMGTRVGSTKEDYADILTKRNKQIDDTSYNSGQAKSVLSDDLELSGYQPKTKTTERVYVVLLGIIQTEMSATGAVIMGDLLRSLADEIISILKQKDDTIATKKKELYALFSRGLTSYQLKDAFFSELVKIVSQITDYANGKDDDDEHNTTAASAASAATNQAISIVFE